MQPRGPDGAGMGDLAKYRAIDDLRLLELGPQGTNRAGGFVGAGHDADLGACAGGIRLRAGNHQPDAGGGRPQVCDVERDQRRTPKGAGEAEQQYRPVPNTGKIVAADFDEPLDLRSGEGGRPARRARGRCRVASRGWPGARCPGGAGRSGEHMRWRRPLAARSAEHSQGRRRPGRRQRSPAWLAWAGSCAPHTQALKLARSAA